MSSSFFDPAHTQQPSWWPVLDTSQPPLIVDSAPATWKPIQPSMKRRKNGHDYSSPGNYMITVVTNDRHRWLLGTLSTQGGPHIELSQLGKDIAYGPIPLITYDYPQIQVWEKRIMPDHIHLILHVKNPLPCHLGNIIASFKKRCSDAFWAIHGKSDTGLFEPGYNDRLAKNYQHVLTWKKYLKDNPYRLALKLQHPELFHTIYGTIVAGKECQIYGNKFLLDNPDKMAVIVHRKDSPEAFTANCKAWRACCERGGVLVGTGVAPKERVIMERAIDLGFSVIKLRWNGFPALYKPNGKWIESCAEGRLLEISPWPYEYAHAKPDYARCHQLNAMAEAMEKGA